MRQYTTKQLLQIITIQELLQIVLWLSSSVPPHVNTIALCVLLLLAQLYAIPILPPLYTRLLQIDTTISTTLLTCTYTPLSAILIY
jgi:hypothetical protein